MFHTKLMPETNQIMQFFNLLLMVKKSVTQYLNYLKSPHKFVYYKQISGDSVSKLSLLLQIFIVLKTLNQPFDHLATHKPPGPISQV